MITLDHLAISAKTLAEGVAHIEAVLGVTPCAGGRHALMGTHNRLLGLGDGLYLEVIAIDPAAPAPQIPRWFDLDRFDGPPRLTNWVARCSDLHATLAAETPAGSGVPMALSRGDLRWLMAVPGDGRLPFDGAFPALIEWQGNLRPWASLPDSRCRLKKLTIAHPDCSSLVRKLAPLFSDARVAFETAPEPALTAVFETPSGERVLR
ncbi:MAG: VOC family protein [Halocynthiibacter sp.]